MRKHRTSRSKHGQYTIWHKPYQYFLGSVSNGEIDKSKNKQMEPN